MHGVKFVRMNDAIVPLATSAEEWLAAYDGKLAMGSVEVNPSAMGTRKQFKAKEAAHAAVTREFNENADYSNLSLDQIAERSRGGMKLDRSVTNSSLHTPWVVCSALAIQNKGPRLNSLSLPKGTRAFPQLPRCGVFVAES